MSLPFSALGQQQNQRKASLLLKNHCIVNPWSSENPQPARGIALAWKCLKDNLPLQVPGRGEWDAAGRCCENLDSSSSRQAEELAVFQQRLLQPGVQPEKAEEDWQKMGMSTGTHHNVFPEIFNLGFPKQKGLTSQAFQEEIRGLLGSAEGCLNAVILCLETFLYPLPSSHGNIA